MATDRKPLAGKAALIMGGSRGIGAGIARRLAEGGADIAVAYLSNSKAAESVVLACRKAGVRAIAIQADAGDVRASRGAVARTASEFGRLDILVNNAVANEGGDVETVTEDGFDRAVAVNLRGPFFTTQAAVSHMTEGGRIVNIGSVFAEMVPIPGIDLYTMSKAALAGLTKAWARDLALKGVTVNCIQPGPIETDMNPLDGELAKILKPMTAIQRYGSVEEIAEMAAYLCGPLGGNVTGAILNNDGGMAI